MITHERIARWESIVQQASKRGDATLSVEPDAKDPKALAANMTTVDIKKIVNTPPSGGCQ